MKKIFKKLTSMEKSELIAAPDHSIAIIVGVHHPVWSGDVNREGRESYG